MLIDQSKQSHLIRLVKMMHSICCYIGRMFNFFKRNHAHVAAFGKHAVFIIDISHTTTHTCREVLASYAQHNHSTAGHILTTVVTHTLNHSRGT